MKWGKRQGERRCGRGGKEKERGGDRKRRRGRRRIKGMEYRKQLSGELGGKGTLGYGFEFRS